LSIKERECKGCPHALSFRAPNRSSANLQIRFANDLLGKLEGHRLLRSSKEFLHSALQALEYDIDSHATGNIARTVPTNSVCYNSDAEFVINTHGIFILRTDLAFIRQAGHF